MNKYRETLLGIAVVAIAGGLFTASFFIREFTRTSLGAGFVPRLTAIILAVLGILLILKDWKARAAGLPPPPPPPREEKVGLTGPLAVILNILLFAAYLLFLEQVGFVILTPVYLFLQILILTDPAKYRLGWYAAISVGVGVFTYYLFVKAFQVMLPNGILA